LSEKHFRFKKNLAIAMPTAGLNSREVCPPLGARNLPEVPAKCATQRKSQKYTCKTRISKDKMAVFRPFVKE
jgi:hypothetical protein